MISEGWCATTVFASDPGLFASASGFDSGIGVYGACDASVVHNTVFSTSVPFSSLEWRFEGTSATIANNLVSHNLRERTVGIASLAGNLEGAVAADFLGAEAGDLHLVAAAPAVDAGVVLEPGLADRDLDDELREDGVPDVGADER